MLDQFRVTIQESIAVKQALLADEELLATLGRVVEACVRALAAGGQLLFCGNGGSAADAQHIAAELSGRFYKNRPALRAEALHVNTSYLTAVANDYGFEDAYRRLVEGITRPGDVLFALSTSGNSPNILRAAEQARSQQVLVVGLTGRTGGLLADHCDFLLNVPSTETPRIQESHILLGHLLCEHVEARLFPDHA
jgi:D-sedoheptulose 7-phosphate isomerase